MRRYRIGMYEGCISCLRCARECSFAAITIDSDRKLSFHHDRCTDCQRCVSFCPTGAIYISEDANRFRHNGLFGEDDIREIILQTECF